MSQVATTDGDRTMLDELRFRGSVSVGELVVAMGVTATAVRQRLQRMMADGLVARETLREGRGRPSHLYRLTEKGQRTAGTNYADLASALWYEVRAIDDPGVKNRLLERIAERMAERSPVAPRGDLLTRMREVAKQLSDRNIAFSANDDHGLPVLMAKACPYPGLAEHDRGVCEMEQLLLSQALGTNVQLSSCRLDGGQCCTFTASDSALPETMPPSVGTAIHQE